MLKMGGFEIQQDLHKMVDMVKFWGAKRSSRCRIWGAKPRRIPTDSQRGSAPPGTLTGDLRQGKSYHACANWSAKSPEVGIVNEARYAGSTSYASAAFRLHDTKGPGKQSKRYRTNFSARRTTVWRNPTHVGLWRCVHCAKNRRKQGRIPQRWDSKTIDD